MTPLHFMISATFILSFTGLIFHRKHFLSVLLCMEGVMLSLFLALSLWFLKSDNINFSSTPMILITFSACEAGAGLALLIITIRSYGSDRLFLMNALKC